MVSVDPKISFIGFGEAAQAFVLGLRQDAPDLPIRVYDVKTDSPQASAMHEAYAHYSVVGENTSEDACRDADIIFSFVTADQAEFAASEAAKIDLENALYLDCNSCAPETKRRAATMIEAAGGCYVDVAVMTPVHPRLHKSPCLMAGPHAVVAQEKLNAIGMMPHIAGTQVGDASTRKMIRSVMIKGLEALTLECFMAAHKAGISEDILTSLDISFQGFDWRRRAPYMIERAMTHGVRRAAEMQESAQTLRDLGIVPHVTDATVLRQQQIGNLRLDAQAIGADDISVMMDAILDALAQKAS